MKSEFYLRAGGVIIEIPKKFYWIVTVFAAAVTIYVGEWVAVFLVLFPCLGLMFFMWLTDKIASRDGIYIKGDKIYIKRFFVEKDILPQQIAGIKIMHMHIRSSSRTSRDKYYPQYYENGDPIYMIFLLSEITQWMYNFKQTECHFCTYFKEEIIAEAEYDPEAVKYLKTLNPDIKVFY